MWWLLREVEVAGLQVRDVTVEAGHGCGVAVIDISSSKTDAQARGVSRRHGCACPSHLCPVKAVRRLWLRTVGSQPGAPLVVTTEGCTPTKAQVVLEIRALARWLGANSGNFTGHSLRVTGAQRMAEAGMSEEKIRLFGRWASRAMMRYVREKLLEKGGTTVASAVEKALKVIPFERRRWHQLHAGTAQSSSSGGAGHRQEALFCPTHCRRSLPT